MDDLDIPDGCWAEPSGAIELGDVCQAVPMAGLVDDRLGDILSEDGDPSSPFVPARFTYALVLGVISDYAIMAAIGTAATIPNRELESLVGAGRGARSFLRLPGLSSTHDPWNTWQGLDGIAFLSHVESFPADDALSNLRVASMSEHGRIVLRRRLAHVVDY